MPSSARRVPPAAAAASSLPWRACPVAATPRIRTPRYALSPIPDRRRQGYGRLVALFLVFRDLPGITRDQYTAAQNALARAARAASTAECEVRYLGGFFLPRTGQAICIFDAESACDIAAINVRAGVPATDVAEAIDLRAAS